MTDPIVTDAIAILREAIEALQRNGQYNSADISYADYAPHGLEDHVRCVVEPLLRIYATRNMEQARDLAGYAALSAAWIRAGCPKSQFRNVIGELYPQIFRWVSEGNGDGNKTLAVLP